MQFYHGPLSKSLLGEGQGVRGCSFGEGPCMFAGVQQVCRSAALQASPPGRSSQLSATQNAWGACRTPGHFLDINIYSDTYVGFHKDKLQLRKLIRKPSSNWSSSEQLTLNFSCKRESHLAGKTQIIDLSTPI